MSQIYKIKRDEICVGKVITDFEILKNGHSLLGKKIDFARFTPCRSMLFIPTEFGYAQDLLYDSLLYPIYGKCDDDVYLSANFILKEAENIGEMLKYFGANDELLPVEIERIRNTYFNGVFPIEHAYNFGLTEVDLEKQPFYDSKGRTVNNPEIIKRHQKLIRQQQFWGLRREFVPDPDYEELYLEGIAEVKELLLDPKYFEILRTYGDKSLIEVLCGYEERMNAFKPHKAEGPIRRLKKYN